MEGERRQSFGFVEILQGRVVERQAEQSDGNRGRHIEHYESIC